MWGIFIGMLVMMFLISKSDNPKLMFIEEIEKDAFMFAEMGYFEGQVDALNDSIKIRKINNCWYWIDDPGFTKDGVQFQPQEHCDE